MLPEFAFKHSIPIRRTGYGMAFLSALEALVFSKAGYAVWGLMIGLGVIGGVLSFWMMRWILAKRDNLLVPPWGHKVFPRFAFFSSLLVVIYVPLISLTMLREISVEEMPPMVFGGLGWLLAVLDSDRKVRGTNESA
jgi:hypothetical protein